MRITVTPGIVRRLWAHMELVFGSNIARKDAPEMQLIAQMLDNMGIMDTQDFLNRFTTTLGKTIYIPFNIGTESPGYNLASQMRICVHEHQHVHQFLQAGPKFSLDYLTDSAHRAAYEVDAFKCNLEINYWLTGELLDVSALARTLVHYACSESDIRVATKALSMVSRTIEQGGVTSDAGKVAVKWLNELTIT